MALQAGFAQTEITPPLGTAIAGWLARKEAVSVRDPLHARAAVIESGGQRLAVVQLDLLSVEADDVAEIRSRAAKFGLAPEAVLCSTTHTHSGPACCGAGEVGRQAAYVEGLLLDRNERLLEAAVAALEPAEIGYGWGYESTVAHCRRVILRDGTVRTHGRFDQPDCLCLESPIDPQVAVLAARRPGGELLGALVNYACHPTHFGHNGVISADFPGEMAAELNRRGCPVAMYLQGAAGDMHFADPYNGGRNAPPEELGRRLAEVAAGAIERLQWRGAVGLRAISTRVELPYRTVTDDEIRGTARGAQRFVDPAIYDKWIPALLEQIRAEGTRRAEVQVLSIDDVDLVAFPGELFSRLGLQLKERAQPRHALALGYSNGWLGYLPHREAFARGGYETTFLQSSCLAPGAGEMLVDTAISLIQPGLPR